MKAILAVLMSGAALMALGGFNIATEQRGKSPLFGRQVYIREGCINCHSQYARPFTNDLKVSGPASVQAFQTQGPVLIGNRRQGPDLSNLGLRRSREWNRQHLIDPQALSPASRMPSYAYLFKEKTHREGEALLDYLSSLAPRKSLEWWDTIYYWKPENIHPGDVDSGVRLFRKHCAQCHGQDARGPDEKLVNFTIQSTDLMEGTYRFAPRSMDTETRNSRLAQIIKYGQPGTSMPGHEYLSDQDVADLLSYLTKHPHYDQTQPPSPAE